MAGKEQGNRIVVPRSSLHDEYVYLVGEGKRLARRAVTVEYLQGGFAVIRSGLEGGETLIVSDLSPAADGMLLEPVSDESALVALRDDAAGRTPVR